MEFVIKPALILMEIDSKHGGITKNSDLYFKLLNSFTIQLRVKKNKREHIVFKGDFRPKTSGRLIWWGGRIDGHDRVAIGLPSHGDRAMITR